MKFEATIANVACTIETADLPQASVEFLLAYGIRQYLQDGAAVSKKDEDGNDRPADEIAAEKEAGVKTRLDNITKGEFKRASGPRVTDPKAKVEREMALSYLKPAYKKAGKELPKGEELAAKIAAFWASEKNVAALGKERDRRVAAATKKIEGVEIEL